ncbi:MAG: EAL domain-containing protein [Gammaproteobacteria bacterium]|nr:EAL domain-containing protein [Gammaproteobacteria bacterium]
MKLRTRLLVSFVGITLFVLIIFGAAAYQIAVDSGIKRETTLLQHIVLDQARLLAGLGRKVRWMDQPPAPSHAGSGHLTLIIDAKGIVWPSPPPSSGVPSAHDKYLPLMKMIRDGKKNGQLALEGKSFIWAIAHVENGPYTLVVLHQLNEEEITSPFKTLGVKMLVAGVIIIWVAIWGALILATVFMKRQDEHNAALIHQALHDELTGLPNRNLLYDRLQQAIYLGRRAQKSVALLVMDLDRFKEVNDALGHQSGDMLLKQTSKRLRETLREFNTVARLGGDEFAVLLPSGNVQQATQLANKVIQLLDPVYNINGIDIDAKASIGIAVYPDHGENAEDLIRRADVAMYQAKQQGIGFTVYAAESDPQSLRRLTLHGDLRHAIENESLMLYYQPEIDPVSGRITGVEALARWNHPKLGLIRPDEFILIAERSGQIKALTELVVRMAFQQYHVWQQAGVALKISINLSARNLHDMRLPAYIGRQLSAWNVPADKICFEITESAMLIDPLRAKQNLMEFSHMGLLLAIDDFGTGHSSLAYLKQLPVSIIKIDKSFVMDMTQDEDDASIVRATIDLAHNLGLKVVAEGVENEEAWSALQALGCDFLQGYYISKPVPADELVRWLARYNVSPITAISAAT